MKSILETVQKCYSHFMKFTEAAQNFGIAYNGSY